MYAFVSAFKQPGEFGFNTQPMTVEAAEDYALSLVRAGRRRADVLRADVDAWIRCGSFITHDRLLTVSR